MIILISNLDGGGGVGRMVNSAMVMSYPRAVHLVEQIIQHNPKNTSPTYNPAVMLGARYLKYKIRI